MSGPLRAVHLSHHKWTALTGTSEDVDRAEAFRKAARDPAGGQVLGPHSDLAIHAPIRWAVWGDVIKRRGDHIGAGCRGRRREGEGEGEREPAGGGGGALLGDTVSPGSVTRMSMNSKCEPASESLHTSVQ